MKLVIALGAALLLSGSACAQSSVASPSSTVPAVGETATIVTPPGARIVKSPGFVVKRTGPDTRQIGRWWYRALLLIVSDDGPFAGGRLEDLGARARAGFEVDGGSVSVEHPVKICGGTQNGWYMEGTFNALNTDFHNEAVLAIGASEVYRATYARPVKYVEFAAAHNSILTLCVVPPH